MEWNLTLSGLLSLWKLFRCGFFIFVGSFVMDLALCVWFNLEVFNCSFCLEHVIDIDFLWFSIFIFRGKKQNVLRNRAILANTTWTNLFSAQFYSRFYSSLHQPVLIYYIFFSLVRFLITIGHAILWVF
jgi:hypothetical protein